MVRRLTNLALLTGNGRFHLILAHCGHHVDEYTLPNLLAAVDHLWIAAYININPGVAFPVVPTHSLLWYRHRSTNDLGLKVLCAEFTALRTQLHSAGIRLVHFLPASFSFPPQCPVGCLSSRECWILALRGLAMSLGVLLGDVFAERLNPIIEHAVLYQIGMYLDPLFMESTVLDVLARFALRLRQLDTPFVPVVANLSDRVSVYPRTIGAEGWSKWLALELAFAISQMSPERETSFMRHYNALDSSNFDVPCGFTRAARGLPSRAPPTDVVSRINATATSTDQSENAQAVSNSEKLKGRAHLLCLPALLHHLRVEHNGVVFPACKTNKCPNLHYKDIPAFISIQRLQRAVAVAPETADPVVREALLAKARADRKFVDRPGPVKSKA